MTDVVNRKIAFNTGRKYTVHGQRIIAVQYTDGVVLFHDIDRMICGEFVMRTDLNKVAVMRAYDHNEYEATSRSHRQSFYTDGALSSERYDDAIAHDAGR